MFFVYILYSPSLDRHYIGQTGDAKERFHLHLDQSTDFTAQADDWLLVFLEPMSSRKEAVRLERRIKQSKSRLSVARYIQDARNTIINPIPLSA